MTMTVSPELHKKMSRHKEVRWSQLARETFENRVQEFEWMEKALRNSKLTEKDSEEIGEKIKQEIWKKFQKRFTQ